MPRHDVAVSREDRQANTIWLNTKASCACSWAGCGVSEGTAGMLAIATSNHELASARAGALKPGGERTGLLTHEVGARAAQYTRLPTRRPSTTADHRRSAMKISFKSYCTASWGADSYTLATRLRVSGTRLDRREYCDDNIGATPSEPSSTECRRARVPKESAA